MFDINLLKQPGLLDYEKNISDFKIIKDDDMPASMDLSIDNEFKKVKIKNTKNYLLILVSIGLFCLIVGSILKHNKIVQKDSSQSIVDIPIQNLLDVLQQNSLYANIDYINFTNKKISFEINILNENIFYDFLNSLDNNLNKGLRAIHKNGKFSIVGDLPWSIKDNSDFTINLLNKEISDFTLDIRKEIYKDKLIIISGMQGVFELLNLIVDLNLIDRFQIQVKEIQSLPGKMPLFQIIIH